MKNQIREFLKQGIVPTVESIETNKNEQTNIEILRSTQYEPHSIKIKEFHKANKLKYNVMKNFLMNRSELQNAVSISRAPQMTGKKSTIIGMIFELSKLPTGTLKLKLEDPSGEITAIISSKNQEVMEKAKYLVHDAVLGFIGSCSKDVFFVNDIFWPDIPQKQIPKTKEDVYVAFVSDTHVGSNVFLKEEFQQFITWLGGEGSDEKQKKLAQKVKYILMCGDVIDGVGVYPRQDNELLILDINEQYKALTNYLKQIPKDKQIIISPGTHEGTRLEDPKPKIPEDLAPDFYQMENLHLVTDPCFIRLHKNKEYPGISILMYHGDSFDYYINKVDALRMDGGYDKGTEIQKFLLKHRHLSPTYGGQEHLPTDDDALMLYQIPDVFLTGHIHKSDVSTYKGVILICSSCFQGKTAFQEKLGHHPDPGKVILLNLRTLKIKILDFNKTSKTI
jgi:DNA polymerase II small subunit